MAKRFQWYRINPNWKEIPEPWRKPERTSPIGLSFDIALQTNRRRRRLFWRGLDPPGTIRCKVYQCHWSRCACRRDKEDTRLRLAQASCQSWVLKRVLCLG